MTPLLCDVWCAPSCGSRSSTSTRRPRSASSRAVASPTIPPPTTATSCVMSPCMEDQRAGAPVATAGDRRRTRSRVEQVERGADDRLRVDLVVLVELGQVARLAEALHAEAGDRGARGAREERERVRVAVDERDDRDGPAEQPVDRGRIALAEPGAGLEG